MPAVDSSESSAVLPPQSQALLDLTAYAECALYGVSSAVMLSSEGLSSLLARKRVASLRGASLLCGTVVAAQLKRVVHYDVLAKPTNKLERLLTKKLML